VKNREECRWVCPVLLIESGLKATGMIASGCAERPKSTSLCSLHRCDKHSRLDVTAGACRMLPETLRAGDATSPGPLIPSEVETSISFSLWNPGRLYKLSPRRISWIISPPFLLSACIHSLPRSPPPLHASFPTVLSFDYSPRLLLPTLCFFLLPLFTIFTRDLTTRHLSRQPNDLYESERSGDGGRCEGCGEVVSC